MSIMNLLISFDDPMERLLYGEPDPWLELFTPRHWAADAHYHDPDDEDYHGYGGQDPALRRERAEEINQRLREERREAEEGSWDLEAEREARRRFLEEWRARNEEPGTSEQQTGGATADPNRRAEATERDMDVFLLDAEASPEEQSFGETIPSRDREPDVVSKGERTEGGDEERDDVEVLIVQRGRVLGLGEAQIAHALARYRASRSRTQTAAAGTGLSAATNPATALLGTSVGTEVEADTPQDRAQQLDELNQRLDAAQQGQATPDELRAIADAYDALSTRYEGTGEVTTSGLPMTGAITAYAGNIREQAEQAQRQIGKAEYQQQFGEQSLSQLTDDLRNANRALGRAQRRHEREGGNRSRSNLRWAERDAANEWNRLPPALREYREALEVSLDGQFLGILETEIKNQDMTPERAKELAREYVQRRASADRQGGASYYPTVTYDSRTNTFGTEWVEDPSDDDEPYSVYGNSGGGGGGGGATRQYEVEDDGTVKFTEGGHTYTVSDEDLANDVREAARSGDASRLSTVDRVTVSGSDGVPVAANFNAAPTDDTGVPPPPVTGGDGNAGGIVGPPQVTQAIANAIAGDGMSSVNVGGVTVSRDSNGNVTVSDADLSVTYRSDGSVAGIRTSDGDGDATQAAEDAGLLVSQPDLVQAAAWSVNPETGWSTVNALAGDDWGALRAAQESWFNEQLANLPEDPAEKAARLAELATVSDELSGEWASRDTAFVDADGNAISGSDYFARVSASLSEGAAENAAIAERNAALPPGQGATTTTVQANPQLGDRFNADRASIDARVVAADSITDPAELAATLAEIAADIRFLEERWNAADTTGWSLGVDHDHNPDTPRVTTTAGEWWGDYAASIDDVAKANQASADQAAASATAVADFNAVVSQETLSPADYARLAEEWRNRPDNDLVQIAVPDPTLEEGGGVVHQSPSGYFARLSGDPSVIAAEERREQERRILPGETGQLGAQVATDPVTGTLQVSAGVAAAVQAQREERERQQRFLPGETGQLGTQVATDPVTGTLQVSAGVAAAVQAQREEQERQQRFLPGETGGPIAIDPITGTLQVSSVGESIIRAQQEEQERQQRILPGETGAGPVTAGGEVRFDPVTGNLQVSQGVAESVRAQQEEQERQEPFVQPDADTLAVIRGAHDGLLTPEDTKDAIGYMFAASKSGTKVNWAHGGPLGRYDTERHPDVDPAVATAWFDRAIRAAGNEHVVTLDSLTTFRPDLTHDQALQELTLSTLLDLHARGAAVPAGSAGSIDLHTDLVTRGMNPIEAARWTNWAHRQGLASYSDVYATAGAVAGGIVGSKVANRFIPVLTTKFNPRLTTGVVRGFTEEGFEETGELTADVFATVATGGNPVGILTDPTTYAYAAGSIVFSGITEADAPGKSARSPSPYAVPTPAGAEGYGVVYSKDGSPVDPELAAEGNRLYNNWAASNRALEQHAEDAPSGPGVDQATWYRRGAALDREVARSGAELSAWRDAHGENGEGLVLGMRGGGGETLTIVDSNDTIMHLDADGDVTVYAMAPGEAEFIPSSGETDARAYYEISKSGTLLPVSPGAPGARARGSDGLGLAGQTGTATIDNAAGVDSAGGGVVRAGSQPEIERSGPEIRQSGTEPATAPQIAPIPTATFSGPLPAGQAQTAQQQETPTPTETSEKGDSSDGRSAPPSVRDPGGSSFTPQWPSFVSAPQPTPEPSPQPSAQPSPSITPSPNPATSGTQPGTQPGAEPTGGSDPTLQPDPVPGTSSVAGPTTFPTTRPIPAPTTQPRPFGTPTAFGQPTTSPPTPATIPDATPTPSPEPSTQPQPEPEPGPTPRIPTVTTTETPTITPTPNRRRLREDDERDTPRRREIPNPVVNDPNVHPREVQYVEPARHTVDLVTGEHTIEPLTDEQVRTAQITGFSAENPEGEVHLAGSVRLQVNPDHIELVSTDRRKDAGDPVDYRDIDFVESPSEITPEQVAAVRPLGEQTPIDLSDINLVEQPGQRPPIDLSDINLVERPNQRRPIDPSEINLVQQPDQQTPISTRDINLVQQPGQRRPIDPSDIKLVEQQPTSGSGRTSNSARRRGGAGGGSSNDLGNINLRPGQSLRRPAAAPSPVRGGGGARRRGGRRRDDEEEERQHRRPVIQVVLNN